MLWLTIVNLIPRRILLWCLIRALGEWHLDAEKQGWEDRSSVAFWRVLDWHVWRARGNGSFSEWSRSRSAGLPEVASNHATSNIVSVESEADTWTDQGGDE